MPGDLRDVVQKFMADNSDYIRKIQEMKAEYASLVDMSRVTIKIDADNSDAMRAIAEVKAALDGLGDKKINISVDGDLGDITRHLQDISTYMDIATDSMGRMEEHLFRINKNVEDSSASLDMQTQMLRDNADAHNNAAVAVATLAAARGRAGGGGGGAAVAAAAGAAAGGGGGGGGGGFVPWAGGGWQAVRFWGMMGAEVASTVVPALVAAGSAALVGAQGMEQLRTRAQALYTVNEALGSSLGKTMGQYLGVGNALQNAQTADTGTVYGLAGGLLNVLKSGAGTGFLNLGTNTLDMISRGEAAATLNLTHGTVGKQLAQLLGGGTGYLREFGDIGANLGKTLLNVAPNLPGVGADLLTALTGATGGAASVTGWLGPALGPILAYEAASRWGPALLGGQGLIGRMLGLSGVGGIGGLLGKAGAGTAGLADWLAANTEGFGSGVISSMVGGSGVGLAKLGGILGSLGPGEMGGIGALALLIGKGATYQTQAQQVAAAQEQKVSQYPLGTGFGNMLSAMNTLAGVPYSAAPGASGMQNYWQSAVKDLQAAGHGNIGGMWSAAVQGMHGALQMLGIGPSADPNAYQTAQREMMALATDYVKSQLGVKGVSQLLGVGSGQAAMLAAEAGLQVGTAVNAKGQLTPTAIQQLLNYQTGLGAMSASQGAFGSNVSLMYAMGSLANSKVSQVNAASDQLAQIVSSGPAGSAALSNLIRAMPAGSGKAMRGYLSPASAAAWSAFASTTQPSVISQLGSQADWLREAMTMGALGGGPAGGMAGYLIGQALPSAKGSPAALAMLSMYAQQFGGPSFMPGTSAAAMAGGLSKWIQSGGMTGAGFNRQMTLSTEHMANLGLDANNFIVQTTGSAGGALAAGVQQYAGGLIANYMRVAGHAGTAGALSSLSAYMTGSKIPLAGQEAIVTAALQMKGASPREISAEMAQLKKDYQIRVNTHADMSGANKAKSALDSVPKSKTSTINAHDEASGKAKQASAAMAAIHDVSKAIHVVTNALSVSGLAKGAMQDVHDVEKAIHVITNALSISSLAQGAMADVHDVEKAIHVVTNALSASSLAQSAMNAVHDVTRFITIVVRQIGSAVGGILHAVGLQTGGLVPGSGSGDIIPAMLEPGEVVIPRYLVSALGPFLTAHRIPGFGAPAGSSSHFAAGGLVSGIPAGFLDVGGSVVPDSIAKLLDQLLAEVARSGIGKQFAVTLAGNVAASLRNMPGATASIAQALVSKITQETGLAKNVASAAMGGQGYASNSSLGSGIFGSMDMTSGQSAVQQTQTYLQTVQSFTKDLAAARKQGLNKDIIAQLVAAGPTQGDAVLQSILGVSSDPRWGVYGGSGVGKMNKLWGQLGGATNALGAQAAMAQYGGFLAPNLKSGTFSSNNITINISAGGGGGTLTLSDAQIKALVAEIQAALLKQAKKNRRTGLQLSGYGS